MSDRAELATLRRRMAELEAELSRATRPAPDAGVPIVVRTAVRTTYPTSAPACVAAHPVDVAAVEVEGGVVTLTEGTAWIVVAVLGSDLPPVGSYLLVEPIGSVFVEA
jgi:hypothetical protein